MKLWRQTGSDEWEAGDHHNEAEVDAEERHGVRSARDRLGHHHHEDRQTQQDRHTCGGAATGAGGQSNSTVLIRALN